MPASTDASNPRKRATQTLEEAIARFSSPEQKRIAISKALAKNPDDEHLKKQLERLTGPDAVKDAIHSGIYISYNRADELFALELTDRLSEAGISVWLDMIEIQDSLDWDAEVEAALARSGLMLAILSPEALTDDALSKERQQYVQAGKLIVPIIHRHCDWQHLTFWLPGVNFIHDFERGLHVLLNLLNAS
jgi:hypothetical protein